MNDSLGSYDLDRELTAQEIDRVVVGIDGSPASLAALRWAAGLTAGTGWPLEAVAVWQRPVAYSWEVGMETVDWEAGTQKMLTAVLDEVFGADRPTGLRTCVLEGDPAHRLADHAAGARLLVVGNRGKGGFIGLLMGSVSTKCASHASCPVLIVHADNAAPRLIAA